MFCVPPTISISSKTGDTPKSPNGEIDGNSSSIAITAINLYLYERFSSHLCNLVSLQVHRHLRPGLAQALAQARRSPCNDAAPWPSGTAGSTSAGNFGGAGDDLHLSQDFDRNSIARCDVPPLPLVNR